MSPMDRALAGARLEGCRQRRREHRRRRGAWSTAQPERLRSLRSLWCTAPPPPWQPPRWPAARLGCSRRPARAETDLGEAAQSCGRGVQFRWTLPQLCGDHTSTARSDSAAPRSACTSARRESTYVRLYIACTQKAVTMAAFATLPDEQPLLSWWRTVTSQSHASLPLLVLLGNANDVANLKASLPLHVRQQLHEFYDGPPAPGFPSLVYGSFAQRDPSRSAARFLSLFRFSPQVRILVVPADEEDVLLNFVEHTSAPMVVVRSWSESAGSWLNEELERTRRSVLPPRLIEFCRWLPSQYCLVLAGQATHHLALMVPGASIKVEHMTLRTAAGQLHRWEHLMRGVTFLAIETSFQESLDPSLYGTGLQGVLRHIVEDKKRTFQVVVLCGDGCVERFAKLNFKDQNWYSFILPSDCEPHTVAASGAAAAAVKSPYEQHPFMSGFALNGKQLEAVKGGPHLFHEDKLALASYMDTLRRRAAVGRGAGC